MEWSTAIGLVFDSGKAGVIYWGLSGLIAMQGTGLRRSLGLKLSKHSQMILRIGIWSKSTRLYAFATYGIKKRYYILLLFAIQKKILFLVLQIFLTLPYHWKNLQYFDKNLIFEKSCLFLFIITFLHGKHKRRTECHNTFSTSEALVGKLMLSRWWLKPE